MVGWPQRLNDHEFEQALGDSEGQGSLACCGPRGCKESDTTELLSSNKLVYEAAQYISAALISFHPRTTHSEETF